MSFGFGIGSTCSGLGPPQSSARFLATSKKLATPPVSSPPQLFELFQPLDQLGVFCPAFTSAKGLFSGMGKMASSRVIGALLAGLDTIENVNDPLHLGRVHPQEIRRGLRLFATH